MSEGRRNQDELEAWDARQRSQLPQENNGYTLVRPPTDEERTSTASAPLDAPTADRNCVTRGDGECVSEGDCMHTPANRLDHPCPDCGIVQEEATHDGPEDCIRALQISVADWRRIAEEYQQAAGAPAPPTPSGIGTLLDALVRACGIPDGMEIAHITAARAAIESAVSRVVKERDEANALNEKEIAYLQTACDKFQRSEDDLTARVASLTEDYAKLVEVHNAGLRYREGTEGLAEGTIPRWSPEPPSARAALPPSGGPT